MAKTSPSFLVAVIIAAVSVAAAQDLFPCEFQLDTATPAETPKPATPVAVKTYIDECLSNAECSNSTYCSDNRDGSYDPDCFFGFIPCDAAPRKCVPRLTANKECQVGTGDCADGLFCSFAPGRKTSNPICVPKLARGARCDSGTYSCIDDLVCSRKGQRCLPFNTGLAGDKCRFDRHCNQQRGFYCKNVRFPKGPGDYEGTCTKKKAQGEICNRATDNFECAGFCLRLTFGPSSGGVCMNRREIGQSCSDNEQCRKYVVWRNERTEDALCNVQPRPGSRQGVCVLESNLLRKPGQACDPARDLCDSRRKLRCEKFNGKFVCLQKSKLNEPCTRGSPYSFCIVKSAGTPLECRRALALTKKTPYGADVCSRVRVTVKQGEICNLAEHAICEKGTTCVRGPGIVSAGGKYPPPPMAYCMKSVPIGGDCSNRFSTVCTEGSYCINKKCQKASNAPDESIIYSGVSAECATRACAPGLSCQLRHGRKSCQLRKVVVGPWKKCSSTPTATIVCVKGTECTRGLEWAGIKRCRPVGGVGAICEKDSGCEGKLKCRPSEPNDFLSKRTCYDPTKASPLGAKCDPTEYSCVVGKERYQVAKCLPKGNLFACQVEGTLFQRCSEKENIGCADGLVCNDKSACIPAGEVA